MAEDKENKSFVDEDEEKSTEEEVSEGEEEVEGDQEPTSEEEGEDDGKEEADDDEEEPEVRFQKKEQSPEEKRLFYKVRKLEKELENLKKQEVDEFDFDTDKGETKPLAEVENKIAELEMKIESENMLHAFLEENPEYKRYANKIRKYMLHPAYKDVPIGFIADGIAGKDVVKDLKIEKEAFDKRAGQTKTGGASKRKQAGGVDFWTMSREEFAEYQAKVKRGEI